MDNKIKILSQLLEEKPMDSFLLHALALEHLKINNYEQAKDCFLSVLKYNPNYLGSYYHLAKLLEQLQDEKSAIFYYEEGMKLAKQLKDNHAYNELKSAYDELLFN
ncbi:MAG: tetratricopeptide repeat protein [Alphaproteobacteria bacterium]|nr:tetratricopeptide repeat protein [Alphaproteobacteria bacterium]